MGPVAGRDSFAGRHAGYDWIRKIAKGSCDDERGLKTNGRRLLLSEGKGRLAISHPDGRRRRRKTVAVNRREIAVFVQE